MATTIYNKQIESFYRSVGEGNITVVNGATSSTLTKGVVTNYQPKRWALEEVYDLFWKAGGMVHRALSSLDYSKVLKQIPSLLTTEEVTLVANVGAISKSFEFVYEEAFVTKSSNKYRCSLIPFYELSDIFTLSTGFRKSPTTTEPKFSLTTAKSLTVYPIAAAYDKITVKGVLMVERLVASTNGSDSWNLHLPDLISTIAVMLAKSETDESSMMQMILRNIQTEYGLAKQKPVINNNKLIEEQK